MGELGEVRVSHVTHRVVTCVWHYLLLLRLLRRPLCRRGQIAEGWGCARWEFVSRCSGQLCGTCPAAPLVGAPGPTEKPSPPPPPVE